MIRNALIFLLLFSQIIISQDNSNLGIDEKTGKPILLGKVDRKAMVDSNFTWWFNSAYKFYKPDTSIINEINGLDLTDTHLKIVLGTWCSDSRREVPRFFKIIDLIEFPEERIEIFGVNRDKILPDTETEIEEIEFVPTFIFYRDQVEIDRIIETPDNSLEEDMLNILE